MANVSNCSGDTQVSSPEVGWNPITVGNFDDRDTGFWGDDVIDSGTWVNPNTPFGDLERPDVVGMGKDVESTLIGVSGIGNIATGTSFAALQSRTPSTVARATRAGIVEVRVQRGCAAGTSCQGKQRHHA